MPIIREMEAHDTYLAYTTFLELFSYLPDLADLQQGEFVRQVNEYQRPEGYRLIGSFEDGVESAVAIAGFRPLHSLGISYYLYLDHLVTSAPFRGRGHATGLMQWLYDEAKRLGCTELHLNSAVVPQRYDAHRFYLNQRMHIGCYHFEREL
jgi:GNAT superfamily N-acetyltransferase